CQNWLCSGFLSISIGGRKGNKEIFFPCRCKQKQVIKKETLVLLRLPFSVFLLPVLLFAWSLSPERNPLTALLVFFILHLLVYPASNGYNSYHDKDTGSIGGLKAPPQPKEELLWLVTAMDI